MRVTPRSGEERHAQFVLGVLLGEPPAAAPPVGLDWDLLGRLAAYNAVLIRLARALVRTGLRPPLRFARAVERERGRARAALHILRRIRATCTRYGIEWLLPKAPQRYPDVGDDLDLLVAARTPDIDHLMLEGLRVTARPPTLAQRLAGSTVYTVTGTDIVLDIRHGRLGNAGQHASFAGVLLQNRRPVTIGGTRFCGLSPEDELVVQGIEKVTGRRSFHLCDVLHTVRTIRGRLDWDYVTHSARAYGATEGLRTYLHYVDEIHERLTGRDLLPAEARDAVGRRGPGHARFRKASFRFPAVWLTARIHARQLALAAGKRDWEAVARLGLWPLAVIGSRLAMLSGQAAS